MLLRLMLCLSMAPSVLIAQRTINTAASAEGTVADTATILPSAAGATSSRYLVHYSSGVQFYSPVLDRRGDTLSIATPATLVFDRAPLELELHALAGDARVQTRIEAYDCILEGPVLRFAWAAPTARLQFLPDRRTRTNCVKRGP